MPRTIYPSGATLRKNKYKLPEKLERKTLMKSTSTSKKKEPCFFRVFPTTKRTEYGEVLYKLKYKEQMYKGWKMPAITSMKLWTRDELQAHGVRIIEG